MKPKAIDSFNQLATRYDSWFDRHAAAFKSEIEALKKVIPSSGKGLEVGVGSGRFSSELGIQTGVDPSDNMCAMAKLRGINALKAEAEFLPFPNEQFDFVLLNTVLCFLNSPLKGLDEAKRVLKPEGILIIGMIDRTSEIGQSYEVRKQDNPFYQDAHFYSVDEMIALINQVGFQPKEIYQTLFSPLDEIKITNPVKQGYGEGGFIVIKAAST